MRVITEVKVLFITLLITVAIFLLILFLRISDSLMSIDDATEFAVSFSEALIFGLLLFLSIFIIGGVVDSTYYDSTTQEQIFDIKRGLKHGLQFFVFFYGLIAIFLFFLFDLLMITFYIIHRLN